MGIRDWAGQFDLELPVNQLEESFSKRIIEGGIDFGNLDETAQTEVIEALSDESSSQDLKAEIMSRNPWLESFFVTEDLIAACEHGVFEENRRIILKVYGQEHYRKQLLKVYKKVEHHVPHKVEKKKVLDAFLHIDNYLPLGS